MLYTVTQPGWLPHTFQKRFNNGYNAGFEHAQIRIICGRLIKPQLDQPLADLINPAPSPDLRFIAKSFIKLQGVRHAADYDTSYSIDWDEARLTIEIAVRALGAWRQLQGTSEANIFVLSLMV